MHLATAGFSQSNNFNLKHEVVDLVPSGSAPTSIWMTVDDLESLRTASPAVSASKHGLEVICGASCETGAQ